MAESRERLKIGYGSGEGAGDVRMSIPHPALESTILAAHMLAIYALGNWIPHSEQYDEGDTTFTVAFEDKLNAEDEEKAGLLAFSFEWQARAEAYLLRGGKDSVEDLRIPLPNEIVDAVRNILFADDIFFEYDGQVETLVPDIKAQGYDSFTVSSTTVPGIVIEHARLPGKEGLESHCWIRDVGATGREELEFILQMGQYKLPPVPQT